MDVSDETTGLPPLHELEPAATIVLASWDVSIGVTSVHGGDPIAIRYLHVRGLAQSVDGGVEWAQVHLAVPVDIALDVAAALAKGTRTDLGSEDGD